ncbi:MAG: sn-glycerol-3-phosphate ABC transporter ATP-binding protein UgpC, partial [Tabrizicola sp.]
LYHLMVEDLPLSVLSTEKQRPAEGAPIGVSVPVGALHLFDADTGRRIEPKPAETPVAVPA